MKILPTGVGSLVFGMKRVRREWVSSFFFGIAIIALLITARLLYALFT